MHAVPPARANRKKAIADEIEQKKGQMRQNDHAHSLKLYIGHNDAILGGRPVPGLGSAIFFHIWRGGGSTATAGCTTMHETMLKQLIARIARQRHSDVLTRSTANQMRGDL